MSIIFLIIIGFTLWAIDPTEWFSNSHTVYPAICLQGNIVLSDPSPNYSQADFYKARADCDISVSMTKTYRINEARGEVTTLMSGVTPMRLVKCAIMDKRNWRCEYLDKHTGIYDNHWLSGFVEMRKGRIAIDPAEAMNGPPGQAFYMRRWQWLVAKYSLGALDNRWNWLLISRQERAF